MQPEAFENDFKILQGEKYNKLLMKDLILGWTQGQVYWHPGLLLRFLPFELLFRRPPSEIHIQVVVSNHKKTLKKAVLDGEEV